MALQITEGKQVKLKSSQGKIVRILVKNLGDTVLICREDEYVAAQREGRDPITIAFPTADILH